MEKIIRLKLTFSYEFIDDIDIKLYNINILHKSFENNVIYIIDVNESSLYKLINDLLLITSKQILIENISKLINNDSDLEVGTDKPLGSKAAIDEN